MLTVIRPRVDDNLVEIGPGRGALTKALLPQLHKLNAIEIDHDLIPTLQQIAPTKLQIYEEDVLKFDFKALGAKLRVVGNLPYNISTPIFFHLLKFFPQLCDLHFMVQKEVAERITATPGNKNFGRLSVILQYSFQTDLLFLVPKEAFNPPPQVTSAVIRLIPRPPNERTLTATEEQNLAQIVRVLFSTRRKMLRSHKWLNPNLLSKLGIDPCARPEDLTVTQFVTLSRWHRWHGWHGHLIQG